MNKIKSMTKIASFPLYVNSKEEKQELKVLDLYLVFNHKTPDPYFVLIPKIGYDPKSFIECCCKMVRDKEKGGLKVMSFKAANHFHRVSEMCNVYGIYAPQIIGYIYKTFMAELDDHLDRSGKSYFYDYAIDSGVDNLYDVNKIRRIAKKYGYSVQAEYKLNTTLNFKFKYL